MRRLGLVLCLVTLGFLGQGWPLTHAQVAQGVQWIWFNEGDPAASAPAETRYFRKTFMIDRPLQKVTDEGTLDVTADNAFKVWVNGKLVGEGNDWRRVYRFDVQRYLVHGKNVVAVEARNTEPGPAGLLVRLAYVPNGQSRLAVVSDGAWRSTKAAPQGWQSPEFNDEQWSPVKVIGAYGKTGPWQNVVWDSSPSDRFTVPAGFVVELAVKKPEGADPFSLVNLTFDAKGRLLVSKENGPILLCTEPDKDGVCQTVKPYCEQVRNCQGTCWVRDALLLVGDGPQGTGLYRVRDVDGDDKTDQVELLHKFRGGMGEHGPHAIIHGPDDWLYLVIGNHAWASPQSQEGGRGGLAANSPLLRWPTGYFGPDQGNPRTTEDVLLPRLNDSRGHAADILAPGGTIWRLDHEGKNMSLVAAGFRNHYDAAFNPSGELFTFDSDMEWDEGLPWYRAVRVCHCPPGADFVWRTGAANTPDYYVDSLPPVLETGRGSPVGVEFYDAMAYPTRYAGAFFMADWSLGIIYAVTLDRDGASFKGRAEKFCVGAPMNVTDLAVGPDGFLYFTMGGRGTQGGVYRIAYRGQEPTSIFSNPQLRQFNPQIGQLEQAMRMTQQPLSAWGRARIAAFKKTAGPLWDAQIKRLANASEAPTFVRSRALDLMHQFGPKPDFAFLEGIVGHSGDDGNPFAAAHAVMLLGLYAYPEAGPLLLECLQDGQPIVRRHACEALIRANVEPPVDALWHLFSDEDRFVRTAARLVIQRIDPAKWVNRIWKEKNDGIARELLVALFKTNQGVNLGNQVFPRLAAMRQTSNAQDQLDTLRVLQLALIHTTDRPEAARQLAAQCWAMDFDAQDWRVQRELAILLTGFKREKLLDEPVHARLLEALLKATDRQQQIHYFYCLRLLHDGWTREQKDQLLAWFDGTGAWTGGHSFTPFLENILRDLNPVFSANDRARVLARADRQPWAALTLIQLAPPDQLATVGPLSDLYESIRQNPARPRPAEMKEAIISALGRSNAPQATAALRRIAETDPGQRVAVARALARRPSAENYPILVRELASDNPVLLVEIIQALKKVPVRPTIPMEPRAEDALPFRNLLLASARLDPRDRWKVVELLRHWTNDKLIFSPEAGDWRTELQAWSRWFGQTFPREPSLPNVTVASAMSKWNFDELLAYLEKDPRGRGDAARGRVVFEKANCFKCHKFGKEGEGIGPDLTTLKSRFKRADVLEALLHPSKVVSDQYRGSVILTTDGRTITGLAAPQGDLVTVLQLDGSKVTLKKSEIQTQVASTTSPMPEKLLDELTLEQIADLFAFMESTP